MLTRERGGHPVCSAGRQDTGGIVVANVDNEARSLHPLRTVISKPRETELRLGARIKLAIEKYQYFQTTPAWAG